MNSIAAISIVVLKELQRRKDAYVLLILTALLTLLAGSINFFNDGRIVRYVKEICLLLVWVSSLVIAVTLAARQLHAERESRTLFSLLAKPVSRAQVLLGKFVGCWLACGVALVAFYGFFMVLAAVRGETWHPVSHLQALWLHWIGLGVIVALVLCGALIFSVPSANATICFVVIGGILMLGRHLGKVAAQLPEPSQSVLQWIYFGLPHLEFYDVRDLIVHNWPPIKAGVITLATLYGAAYAAFFLGLACFLFRRKTLNA